MKRVKVGIVIVILVASIYFVISYSIFFIKKSFIDRTIMQYEKEDSAVVVQTKSSIYDDYLNDVIHDSGCKKSSNCDFCEDVTTESLEFNSLDERTENIQNVIQDVQKMHNPEAYSFVTMPQIYLERLKIPHSNRTVQDYLKLDADTQELLGILIGNDFNSFINLILQSNNDIVSKEACRSCSLYALFKKVKHHKDLTMQEVLTLQHLIGNLYRFMESMKQLSRILLLSPEQYQALQELHRTEGEKHVMRLQSRQAVTQAALRKLQSLPYNN